MAYSPLDYGSVLVHRRRTRLILAIVVLLAITLILVSLWPRIDRAINKMVIEGYQRENISATQPK